MKKLSISIFASLVFLFASCNNEKVYHASDFGIIPDTGADMTKEIADAIEFIKAERKGKPSVLLFEVFLQNLFGYYLLHLD